MGLGRCLGRCLGLGMGRGGITGREWKGRFAMDGDHRMPPGVTDSRVRTIQVGNVYCGCRIDHWTRQAGSGITPLLYQGFLLELYIEH